MGNVNIVVPECESKVFVEHGEKGGVRVVIEEPGLKWPLDPNGMNSRDLVFTLFANLLVGMIDYAEQSGEGYPLEIENSDSIVYELTYALTK
jgi:hypothetical protein